MDELFKKQRQFISIYAVWFFINLVCLFIGFTETSDKYREEFWPFAKGDKYHSSLAYIYDFSEFLVYGIGPLVIWFAYTNFTKDKK